MYQKIEAIVRWKKDIDIISDKAKAIQIITKFALFEENEILSVGILFKNHTKNQYLAILPQNIQIVAFDVGSFSEFRLFAIECITTINEHFGFENEHYDVTIQALFGLPRGKPFFNKLTASSKKIAFIGDEVVTNSIDFSIKKNERKYNLTLFSKKRGLGIGFSTVLKADSSNIEQYLEEIEIEIENHLIPEIKKVTSSRRE